MGLYIQGIELPKEQNVPTWAVIFSNGEVRIYKDGFNTDQGNGKGTAIPVPPHGRLINADARVNVQMYNDEFEDSQTVNMSIDDLLDSSWIELEDDPTIIPAEPAKEAQP